jgi:hypothetical protein
VDNISFPKPKGYGKLKRGVQPYQSSNPLSWCVVCISSSISERAPNGLWAAAGAERKDLVNGGYHIPIGRLKPHNNYVWNK